LAIFQGAEEAGLVAFVADAGAEGFDLDEDAVFVAVGLDGLDDEGVAGRFALFPELVAAAAVEGGEAGLDGGVEGFAVHEADHEDAAGGVVLNDGGDQAAGFVEVEIHSNTHKGEKTKSPPSPEDGRAKNRAVCARSLKTGFARPPDDGDDGERGSARSA